MQQVLVELDVGQDLAMRAGLSCYGRTRVELDVSRLTAAEREELTRLVKGPDGTLSLISVATPQRMVSGQILPRVPDDSLASIRYLLAEHYTARSVYEAERAIEVAAAKRGYDADLQVWLDQADEDCLFRARDGRWRVRSIPVPAGVTEPVDAVERCSALLVEALRRNLQLDRLAAEAEARARIEASELRKQHDAQIAEWVATRGSPNQQRRAERDLLPREEVIDAIRDEAFARLTEVCDKIGISTFIRISDGDVLAAIAAHPDRALVVGADVRRDWQHDARPDAAQFEALEEIEGLVASREGGGTVRYAACLAYVHGSDEAIHVLVRQGVAIVEVTVGAFTFTRYYALPPAAEPQQEPELIRDTLE